MNLPPQAETRRNKAKQGSEFSELWRFEGTEDCDSDSVPAGLPPLAEY
jgi:hypothetical protein